MACCPVTGVFGLTVIKKVSAVTLVAGHQNLKRLSLVAHGAFELWVGFSIEHFSFRVEFRIAQRRCRERLSFSSPAISAPSPCR
jgi:hypothetical protein